MPTAMRESLLLICGVLLGIVVGAALILFFNLDPDAKTAAVPEGPADSAAAATARMGAASAPAARAQGASAAPQPGTPQGATASATPGAANRVSCPVRPLLATAGPKDGQLLPPADVAGKGVDEAERLLTVGKEAAAAGLVRDAEVALLTSCRIADARKGPGSVESATAKYQLARHYAGLAAQGNAPAPEREELRRRAEAFYGDSLQSFRAALGPEHERTRFAAEGLAALQRTATAGAAGGAPAAAPPQAATAAPAQQNAGTNADPTRQAGATAAGAPPATPAPAAAAAAKANPPAVAPAREPAATAARSPAPATERPNAAPRVRENAERPPAVEPRVRQATGTPNASLNSQQPAESSTRPSFDCARARSVPEKIICGDAELSRMDRDLSRLHARAKDAAPDPSAFKRQNDNEWRRREANCRDRDCLLDWYGQRRRQLQESLAQSTGRRSQETAAR
jgi:hypothetical protein